MLADSAYGTGPARAALEAAAHTAIIKPWPVPRNPNLDTDQFHRDDFIIDYTNRTVTCPNAVTVTIPANGYAKFRSRCIGCPLRSRCTTNRDGRAFKVGEHDHLLAAARAEWQAGERLADYRQHRPMVERSIAWLVANGHRRVRYRGVERNRQALTIRAAVLNLRRLINLGLDHSPTAGRSHDLAGPGLTTRERHLRHHSQPARPTLTLEHRLFGAVMPRTRPQRYDHHQPKKRADCSAVS